MGLLTSTVGSFPKPAVLARARRAFAQGDLDEAQLQALEQDAIRATLGLQAELGLDLLVTGELDRDDIASFFADRIDGMEAAGLVRSHGNTYVRKARIVGAVTRSAPMALAGWKFAQAAATKPVKAVLTGPYSLMDAAFDEHYASREACVMALAEIMRQEAHDLAAAGAADIQLDEPAIAVRPADLPLAARALGLVTAGLRGKVRTWAHVCAPADGGPLEPLFALPVDGLLLELSGSGAERSEALRRLPADKILGAGVVDVRPGRLDSQAAIRARIERLADLVPPERLWINPDCGLSGRSDEDARALLAAMVGAAGAVRSARGA